MESVRAWLDSLGLGQYGDTFEDNGLDLEVLALVSERELELLGVRLGHRKRLLKALAELCAPANASPEESAAATPPSIPSTPSAESGERRQLTVLFCDMVGFTELANRVDPEVLRALIRSYEDACAVCITRYEGYVFQRLGDGIVAFFGYPLAHEGEAERAIRGGLEILESLSKLEVPEAGHFQVRIGIATGMVVVSASEKSAVGETMNLASRLQAVAQPGSIVVSDRVHRLAGGSFDYEDLGEQTLKGIAQQTRVWRVKGISAAASRFEAATQEGLTPLVGRDIEIGLLNERWELAQEGEGQVALLAGEPGIGKSRILSTLRERLEAQGARPLRFQCSPYYVNSAFYPSIDNFERALKFGRDEPPESRLDKIEALVVDTYGRPLADVRYIASILSVPCEERYGPLALTPQRQKDETIRTLVDLTEAAARQAPSVMLFEDVHWADPTTLEVLDLLIDRVKNIPLLVVLTHRPEFQPTWGVHGHVTALALSRLTRPQSGSMIQRLAGGKSLPSELVQQIIARTDGVPLFVEELTKSILESGTLRAAGDKFEYAGSPGSVPIPATLRDSLMARLDRLLPVKEIAQIGAAIGREFTYEVIAAVAPLPEPALLSALEQLTDSGLAFRRGTVPNAVYTFKHALVQDAAYDSLLKTRRQALHAKIARVLEERFPSTREHEPELLAHHLTEAGLTEPAIFYWRRAGESALKRLALTEAISHLEAKGLALAATLQPSNRRDALELDLRVPLGNVCMALRGWASPEVWSAFHPAYLLAKSLGRHEALLPVLWGLWANVLCSGRIAEALGWAQTVLTAAESTGDEELLIAGQMAASVSHYWLGNHEMAKQNADALLALHDNDKHRRVAEVLFQDPKTHVLVYVSLWTWMLGYPDQAARASDFAATYAAQRGHVFDHAWARTFGADCFHYRREPEELRKRADEGERIGRAHSLPFLYTVLAPLRQRAAMLQSDDLAQVAEGVRLYRETLALLRSINFLILLPIFHATLAEGMARTGDLDGALRIIDEAVEQVERPGWQERSHYAEVLRVRGWILQRLGKLAEAERVLSAAIAVAREQQTKSWELRASLALSRLLLEGGRHKAAKDLLTPIYGWFTEGFDTPDLKEAKALLEAMS